MDAQQEAKAHGADIVKQWDSTLDGRTRATHRELDGQIRELDEPFEIHGKKAQAPGYFGDPAEDCNCRCYALTRSRFAVDWDKEHGFTKMDNHTGELRTFKNAEDYDVFKEKYLNTVENDSKILAGAKSGAYDDKNDPDWKKRDAHAEVYYNALRNSNKDGIVRAISTNAKVDLESVSKMYDHLLINEYSLDGGMKRFDPDYDIAESIQRLREGNEVKEHDLILIGHEALEYDLMNVNGLSYDDAHNEANKRFNYQEALEKWREAHRK